MGRRARTKQSPPEPLVDPREPSKPSKKKLGKRKAEPELEPEENKRPAKKVKEESTKEVGSKGNNGIYNGKKVKGKKSQQTLATSWDDADAEENGDGWEDAEEGDDPRAQAQWVLYSEFGISGHF